MISFFEIAFAPANSLVPSEEIKIFCTEPQLTAEATKMLNLLQSTM